MERMAIEADVFSRTCITSHRHGFCATGAVEVAPASSGFLLVTLHEANSSIPRRQSRVQQMWRGRESEREKREGEEKEKEKRGCGDLELSPQKEQTIGRP